jgi:hypothetical protein
MPGLRQFSNSDKACRTVMLSYRSFIKKLISMNPAHTWHVYF